MSGPDDVTAPPPSRPRALFPLVGLDAPEDRFELVGIEVERVPLDAWAMLEPQWVVDLYRDVYAARPRFFATFDVEGADVAAEIATCRARLTEALLLARLAAPGVLVDPAHLVGYFRDESSGMTQRALDDDSLRLAGSAFGEPIVLPARTRSFGGRTEHRPLRAILPSGPAFLADAATRARVETLRARWLAARSADAHGPLRWPVRNLWIGCDPLLGPVPRAAALFAALEGALGRFGRPGSRPSMGERVRTLLTRLEGVADDEPVAAFVEDSLRGARNAVAHGSVDRRGTDVEAVLPTLEDVARVAVAALLGLTAERARRPDGRGERSASADLCETLDAADGGDPDAARRLEAIRLA